MIIKSFEIKKSLNKNVNIYLFYGPNSGLIEDLINENLKPIFSKNLYSYEETEILSDIENFKENIFNKSFFETDKLIIINRVTDKLLSLIKEISEVEIDDLKIILKSGNLEKKSKMRVFFEKDKKIIITPCYEDTFQSLLFVAQKILTKNKIKISTQNINYIIEKSKGNRISLKNDLEKIIQYSKQNAPIEFENIENHFFDTDDFIDKTENLVAFQFFAEHCPDSVKGAFEYVFDEENLSLIHKISRVNNLITKHEEEVANPILEYIENRDDLNLIGKNKILNKNRAPTISFTSQNKSSMEISKILVSEKIATRNDNFYAWRCLKALNIDTDDGVVRLSLTHYNSIKDTNNVINGLEKI